MTQLDMFTYSPPADLPAPLPPRLAAPVLVEPPDPTAWDDADEDQPAIVGRLSAAELAHYAYCYTCPLNCIGKTEFCHQCALFQSAARLDDGQIQITCKAGQYTDDEGRLLAGYCLFPGCAGELKSRPQWVREIILDTQTIRERPAREVKYTV